MNNNNSILDGFLIALAWPETRCKQAGAWYDGLMRSMGINKGGYYSVGHAALVLVDRSDNSCHYYDFGRYHSPHGYGRVRSAHTDHDLKMMVKAEIEDDRLINLDAILKELYNNPSTHGDGTIYGKETPIDLQKAKKLINKMMDRVFIPYGPFLRKGTNCSRFVNSTLIASHNSFWMKLRFLLPWTVSPSPIEILKVLGNQIDQYGHTQMHTSQQEDSQMINPVSV